MVLLASEFDQSKHLKAEGFKQEKKFRNKAITAEVFERDGKSEKKLVLWFTNSEQGLILNKTNLRTLQGAFGDNTANWEGKIIVVYPTLVPFGGKMVPGLRVRIPPPKPVAAAPPQPATSSNSTAAPGNGAAPAGNSTTTPSAAAAVAPLAAAALAAAALAAADPELEPDPVKSIGDDLEDEIVF